MSTLRLSAFLALLACACAGGRPGPVSRPDLSHAPGGIVEVEDSLHGVKYQLPDVPGGWRSSREGAEGDQPSGGARYGGGVQVEVASFPLAHAGSAAECRETARERISPAARTRTDGQGAPRPAGSTEGPRDQAVTDEPTATWTFTRGPTAAPQRSRWAFFPRGSDCLMLEVTGSFSDGLAERVFALGVKTFSVLALTPDRQREVDLLAGMGFLERRDPAAALDRFEELSRREPSFAKAHFGALMAGFEIGAAAYARALPHGQAALRADRELSPEQRQLALRAVGVMQLAQNEVRGAVETLSELVVRAPDLAEGQYNYACALSRAGNPQAALDHLAAALRLDASLAGHAREDDDLKALRGIEAFERLLREKQAGADPGSGPKAATEPRSH